MLFYGCRQEKELTGGWTYNLVPEEQILVKNIMSLMEAVAEKESISLDSVEHFYVGERLRYFFSEGYGNTPMQYSLVFKKGENERWPFIVFLDSRMVKDYAISFSLGENQGVVLRYGFSRKSRRILRKMKKYLEDYLGIFELKERKQELADSIVALSISLTGGKEGGFQTDNWEHRVYIAVADEETGKSLYWVNFFPREYGFLRNPFNPVTIEVVDRKRTNVSFGGRLKLKKGKERLLAEIEVLEGVEGDLKKVRMELRKEKPMPEAEATSEELQKLKSKKVVDEKRIEVSGGMATVFVWDYQSVDGDIIDVFLNGKLIKQDLVLTKERFEIDVSLISGRENEIKFVAKSEGSAKPCTIRAMIKETGEEFTLKAKEGEVMKITFGR